jgi:hypothetical protein
MCDILATASEDNGGKAMRALEKSAGFRVL